MRPRLARSQRCLLILVAVLAAVGIGVGCTLSKLQEARPAITAVEAGLVAAGQPAAAATVEAGVRAWEAALYLAGAVAAAWGARKGARAGARAIAQRRAAKAGGTHAGRS